MATTTFSFPPEASGLAYTVRDSSGASVATGTLADGDDVVVLEADLPWGDFYSATAGAYAAQGEVQEVAAPGGGVVIDGASLFFEINDGAELDPTGQTILTWDTQPDGYVGSETQIQLEPGLYHVGAYIEITRPAEDRSATVGISSQNSIQSNVGPLLVSAAGGDVASSTIEASGVAIVRGGGDTSIQVSLNLDVLDSEPSPADIEIGYAALTITPIG